MKVIQQIKSSAYLKKIASLFSATVLGQVLPFLFIPLLSRLYSPEDYSEFGVFMTIVGVVSQLGILRLDQAILIPETHEEAIRLAKSSFKALFIISLISSFVSYVVFEKVSYALLIGLTSVVIGANSVFLQLANRMNFNKTIGYHKLLLGVTVSLSQIGFHVLSKGLLVGKMIGDFSANLPFLKRYVSSILKEKATSFKQVWSEYKKFPLITLPHSLFNIVGNKLPTLIFVYLGAEQLSGEYENVFRIGMAPLTVIAQTMYLSFSARFVELHKESESVRAFLVKNIKGLIVTVVLPMIPIIAAAYWLLPYFLGEQWVNSGLFFVLLSPMLMTTVLVSPFVYIPQYVQKQNVAFGLEILINVMKFLGLYIGLFFSSYWGVFLFALFGAAGHFLFLAYCFRLARRMDLQSKKLY